jgi:hypothetical protein
VAIVLLIPPRREAVRVSNRVGVLRSIFFFPSGLSSNFIKTHLPIIAEKENNSQWIFTSFQKYIAHFINIETSAYTAFGKNGLKE